MNITDIIALAGAGFTKNDILRIASNQRVQTPTPTPTPAPTQAPTPTQAPVQVPVQAPVGAQGLSATFPPGYGAGIYQQNGQDFGNKLDQILGAVQSNNMVNSQMPKEETVEDMLASIINPPEREVK